MNTYGSSDIFDLTIWIKETGSHGDLGRVGLMCAMRKSTAVVDQSDDHMACDDRMDYEWRLMGKEGMNSWWIPFMMHWQGDDVDGRTSEVGRDSVASLGGGPSTRTCDERSVREPCGFREKIEFLVVAYFGKFRFSMHKFCFCAWFFTSKRYHFHLMVFTS